MFNTEKWLINVYEHEFNVRDDQPFICRTYSVPMALHKSVVCEIDSLMKAGKIRRS